ncbi:MAG: 50S ribosomal protein L30 [Oscillospiraceae bacterium]|nr:50S ribosomal protein L30 [Oscillospiraceae bacterium]
MRLKRGFSGKQEKQIATARSLGLRRIGDTSVQPDNAATRGKIAKISHMIDIIGK